MVYLASPFGSVMVNLLAIRHPNSEIQQRLYEIACDQWTGCNWRTAFGPLRLNLMGMRSRQATLMAEATSGEESAAWSDAVDFLSRVENDSRLACNAARCAVVLAAKGEMLEAIAEADRAVALEAKYHDPVVWSPLRNALGGQELVGAISF